MTGWNDVFRNICHLFNTTIPRYIHNNVLRIMFVTNYICLIVVGLNVMVVTALTRFIQFINICPENNDSYLHISKSDRVSHVYMVTAMDVAMKGMTFLVNLLPIRISITGDELLDNNFIIIANHQSNHDSILIHYWATMYNKGKHIRVLYKSSLTAIPVFSYIIRNLNYIPVTRTWKNDKDVLDQHIKKFEQYQRILIYPEGTRFSEKRKLESIKYARENNLPIMDKTLVPRVKGFNLILENTKWTQENPITVPVYDVTLVYHPWCIHIHAKRYNRQEYGSVWLIDRFKDKNKLFSQSPPTPTNVFSYIYIEHFCLIVLLFYIMYHYIGNVHYQCLLGASTLFFWIADCFGLY
jgi:1-acyl-sn-glycerol-3-phosphate acyltransferase